MLDLLTAPKIGEIQGEPGKPETPVYWKDFRDSRTLHKSIEGKPMARLYQETSGHGGKERVELEVSKSSAFNFFDTRIMGVGVIDMWW